MYRVYIFIIYYRTAATLGLQLFILKCFLFESLSIAAGGREMISFPIAENS